MKWLISIFFLGSFAHASRPKIPLNDLTYSKGTGVEKIQFMVGGPKEEFKSVDEKAIRKIFRRSMLGMYRCYSQFYGGDSDKTGRMLVRMTLISGSHPSNVQIETDDFKSKDFVNCVQEHWAKTEMVVPVDNQIGVVVMPILARLRKAPHG